MRRPWRGHLAAVVVGVMLAFLPGLLASGCESSLEGLVGDVTGAVAIASAARP